MMQDKKSVKNKHRSVVSREEAPSKTAYNEVDTVVIHNDRKSHIRGLCLKIERQEEKNKQVIADFKFDIDRSLIAEKTTHNFYWNVRETSFRFFFKKERKCNPRYS